MAETPAFGLTPCFVRPACVCRNRLTWVSAVCGVVCVYVCCWWWVWLLVVGGAHLFFCHNDVAGRRASDHLTVTKVYRFHRAFAVAGEPTANLLLDMPFCDCS